jgi:hypothetical protein
MKMQKTLGFVLGMALFAGTPLFSQDLMTVQKTVEDFSGTLAKSLPFNAALGLNWSDAYIGKLLPSVPPHFGAGLTLGYTTMNFDAFDGLLKEFGLSVPDKLDMGQMAFPAYVAEARIGGFALPFDAGFKFGAFKNAGTDSAKMDYLLTGGELRYAIIDGKENPLLPNISLGVGLNYLSGGFTGSKSSLQFASLPGLSGSLTLNNPEVGLQWETLALDFKAQVSQSVLILTPYVGLGASHAWSKAGYTMKADSLGLNDAQKAAINADLKSQGVKEIDFDGNGFSTILKETGWSFRAFGGLSVDLALFRLDLTGMFNFVDCNYGVTLGGRFLL